MLVFPITLLLLFLIGFLISLKTAKEILVHVNKKEHQLYILYPLADLIIKKTGLRNYLKRNEVVTDSIKALYFTTKPELLQKLYWCQRVARVIAVIVLFNFLSIMGFLLNLKEPLIKDGKYILRPGYGEGGSEVEVNVTLEKDGISRETSNNTSLSQEFKIHVDERAYTDQEINEIFKRVLKYVKEKVLGENSSEELIYSNLNFIHSIPGTSITVEWAPKDYSLIKSDGRITNDSIGSSGVQTAVTVILKYRDNTLEHDIPLTIMPKIIKEEDEIFSNISEQINTYAEKTEEKEYMELPVAVDKYRLDWSEKQEKNSIAFLFLGIIVAATVWLGADKELDKQMKKRKEQLLFDYPELVNKFTLLINAGMTIKQAWVKLAEDYCDKYMKNNKKKRFAYEEMLITCNELKLGIPENIAYEQYGRRTGLIPYIKFSSLIAQNLRKGNKGFSELLMKEAMEALGDRKELAKRLGEEASTKLLIPMMIMLILIFLIIMVPAFRTLQF